MQRPVIGVEGSDTPAVVDRQGPRQQRVCVENVGYFDANWLRRQNPVTFKQATPIIREVINASDEKT